MYYASSSAYSEMRTDSLSRKSGVMMIKCPLMYNSQLSVLTFREEWIIPASSSMQTL
jgi:hypothetical protein